MADNGHPRYIFVYGTLLEGERNERWAINVRRRIKAISHGELYDVGCVAYPAFYPNAEKGGEVYGEVLVTDDEGVANMDILEGYPNLYERARIVVRGVDSKLYSCEVYVMRRDPIASGFTPIECGSWIQYRKGLGA